MTRAIAILKKIGWAFLLWLFFSAGCFISPFLALGFPLVRRYHYPRRVLYAADRLCAAMVGFSGRHMLSTEVGFSPRLTWLHDALNSIEPNHCEKSIYAEGPYCRISDHELGIY